MAVERALLFNLVGTIFDKGLPFIIVLMANKYMQAEEFGLWALFSQFQIAVSTIFFSPIYNRFMRQYGEGTHKTLSLRFYNFSLVTALSIAAGIFFFLIYNLKIGDMLLLFLYSLLFVVYNYLGIQFRFFNKDFKYARHSFFRFIIIFLLFGAMVMLKDEITLTELLLIVITAHIPVFLTSIKFFKIIFKNDELKEYFQLAGYGLASTMTNSIEKFSYGLLGLSVSQLGYYHFIYTITSIPTIIVEVMKKTYQPRIYKNLGMEKVFYSGFKKTFLFCLLGLLILQVGVPLLAFYFLKEINFINQEYLKEDIFYHIVFLAIGFIFYNTYHFINPYYFFFKKSGRLIFYQVISIGLFMLFVLVFNYGIFSLSSIESVIISKVIMFISITLLTYLGYISYARRTN